MATYVLIPGAASSPWHWHLLDAELRRRGHDVVTVDLPCDDDAAGLSIYTDTVLEAIDGYSDLVLVAHSFAGFTAPLVANRTPVDLLVLLNAMIPAPGETPGQWFTNTGHAQAKAQAHDDAKLDGAEPEGGVGSDFFHDLSPQLTAEAAARLRDQSSTPFEDPWPLAAWPTVQTKVLIARHDRLFPRDLQRRIAHHRLGITPDEMDGGHFVALGQPRALSDRLEAYQPSVIPNR